MADQAPPPGREWTGSHKVAKDSRWLCAEDLPADRDVQVEIEKVLRRDNLVMQEGRPMKVALSLKFRGKQKELILNATNRKTLAALFNSQDCGEWFGKRIALFVKQGVRYPDGTKGPAIRIRAQRIAQGGPQRPAEEPPEPALTGEEMEALLLAIDQAQMVADLDDAAVCELAGIESIDGLRALPPTKLKLVLKELAAKDNGLGL